VSTTATASSERPQGKADCQARWFPQDWRRIPEALRWRDPLRVLLLATREALSPFMYWYIHLIVENDLRQPLRQPYAKRSFDARFYKGMDDFETVTPIILSMGELTREAIASRCRRGDEVAIVYAGDEPAGYVWMTRSSGLELAFATMWVVGPDEAVLYGSFVHPKWRGQGAHSVLDYEACSYARQRGLVRLVGSISALNSASLRLARRQSKPTVMKIFMLHIRGVGWTFRKTVGAPLDSHFEVRPSRR
jgi:GNAT superfamily N-acetyltransferase